MNRKIFALSLLLGCGLSAGAQDYFWTPSGDRYKAAESIRLDGADSVVFRNNRLQVYRDGTPENWMYSRVLGLTTSADSSAAFYIGEPERALWKPTTSDNNYNNNYSNPESRWSFKNSRESKHFIVFWDKQFGDNPLSTGVPSNLRVDVTDAWKEENEIAVRVTTLWPNRLIGDELLPEDRVWQENGHGGSVAKIPDWVWKGEKSPTGRHTFTTWRHWRAEDKDKLCPAGLIGPVKRIVESD